MYMEEQLRNGKYGKIKSKELLDINYMNNVNSNGISNGK